MTSRLAAACSLAVALLAPAAASAQPFAARDSFRIGSSGSLVCIAQAALADPALAGLFDRGYAIACRDAALPVGHVYALRSRDGDPLARLAAIRGGRVACQDGPPAEIAGVGSVDTLSCRLNQADVAYRVYVRRAGGTLYVAEGLAGYGSALELALRSVIEGREVEGEVSVATTGAGDPAAFARVQAGALDPQRALAEAYRRNNAGSYAEAAEFFGALTSRGETAAAQAEALANAALQKSNLGLHAEAEALLARAAGLAGTEPVTARRLRNYRAMHLLNQGLAAPALAELARPMPPLDEPGAVAGLTIDRSTAARLSAESPGARGLGAGEGLSAADKAQILDGQALQLRGTLLRLAGRDAEAVAPLNAALDALVAIREGRIAATIWLRAQIYGELAAIAEARGDAAETERLHREAVALLEANYPGSAALLTAKGRRAGHLVRAGQSEAAIALYREIVGAVAASAASAPTLRTVLAPYFALLAERGTDPAAVAELFAAGQLLVRPGVAQTQAALARELSGGSDEASRLFRQAVTLTRDIERARVELARIAASPAPGAVEAARAAALRASLEQLQRDQTATQARLADFPRYRVVSAGAIALTDLQQLLRPGEAYYKMIAVDEEAYALFVTPDAARAFRIGAVPAELERQVDALRATISTVEAGEHLTYPFDLDVAHSLYRELFGPVGGEIGAVRHLVFEPDGALLRLPPNLLVTDEAGIAAYRARTADPKGDAFDFRGVEWLGRGRDISTSVSARAFRDVRQAPPSHAPQGYLGFGQNEPVPVHRRPDGADTGIAARDPCSWPPLAWNRPIPADELYTARNAVAGAGGAGDVVTDAAFSDSAIRGRTDLDAFRILHFATHGLVAGPKPECPAQPALLTSFGEAGSDGLLTFSEIFDLRLDADLVILSACDTAGRGSRAASEAAGLTGSGDFSLDGLVRAFIGAGSRLVIGSHWPVPVDFEATQRLISGLFTAPPGTGTAGALRAAQMSLMDGADTSHPYYWSAFAVVGDGSAPVIRAVESRAGGGN